MSEVVFQNGVTLDQIDYMETHLREAEKTDFLAAFPTVREGLIRCCNSSDADLQTATVDGELVAIFGLSTGWIDDPEIANPWLALTENAFQHRRAVFAEAKRIVWEDWAGRYRLLCNFVPVFDEEAIRFLRHLGFQFLSECVEEGRVSRVPFYLVGGRESQCA